MSYSDRRALTEDCPLRKEATVGFTLRSCCGGGLKIIVCSFVVLTIAITAALLMQLLYTSNISQGLGHGAVATDYTNCSQIGTKMLNQGGNAVDAAVAATICMTVVNPHKTGLGGGGYVMIYNHKEQSNPMIIDFATNTIQGIFAERSLRLPSVLRGLELAHSLRGNLPWKKVVEPSSQLARQGFIVSKELASEVSSPSLSSLYGQLEPGQNLSLPVLAQTLDAVAEGGADVLYNGTLTNNICNGSQEMMNQFASYKPQVIVANASSFYSHIIYYPPQAEFLQLALNAVDALRIPMKNASSIESQVLLAKTLVNIKFNHSTPDSGDTSERFSSVVAMDGADIYVSILTGLSSPLDSLRMTKIGFLLDEIGSGSTLSSLSPIIFRNENSVCGKRGVLGSDNSVVTTQLLYNLLVRELNVSAAIENPRYYLLSDGIAMENDEVHSMDAMLRVQLETLSNPSHNQKDDSLLLKSCNAITKYQDSMNSHSDSRGGGVASRF